MDHMLQSHRTAKQTPNERSTVIWLYKLDNTDLCKPLFMASMVLPVLKQNTETNIRKLNSKLIKCEAKKISLN